MRAKKGINKMLENEFKNQKIREDIRKEFSPAEAKLALGILSMVENTDGNPNPDDVKKLADACFKEKRGE